MTNGQVSNRDLYDAVNGVRSELGGAIQRLDDKFTTLEAGRLTRAEANINDLRIELLKATDALKQNQATISLKFVAIQTIGYILLFVILQAVTNKWLK